MEKGECLQIICIIFVLILTTSTCALSEETELIWKIGERDGSWSEFNPNSTGHVHYYVGTNLSNFPHDLNDGYMNRTHIYIHYNLTDKQAKKDTNLSLCVADHGPTDSFGFRVSVNDIKIGNYSFISKNIPDSCKIISINKTLKSGENVMLIENIDPPLTDHWVIWDYLNLTTTDPYCGDGYCDRGENCEQDDCCNGEPVNLTTDKNNCGICNNVCDASCCESKCAMPKNKTSCYNGDVYWFDSCGNLYGLFDDCNSSCCQGKCAIVRYEKSCYNSDVYWFDSCGNRGELFDDCSLVEDCSDRECKTNRGVIIVAIITVIGGILCIIVKYILSRRKRKCELYDELKKKLINADRMRERLWGSENPKEIKEATDSAYDLKIFLDSTIGISKKVKEDSYSFFEKLTQYYIDYRNVRRCQIHLDSTNTEVKERVRNEINGLWKNIEGGKIEIEKLRDKIYEQIEKECSS